MDIAKGSIYELLNGKYQYIVPVYQRKYSWLKEKQCERLWNDIVKMEQSGKKHHFVGSIVNISDCNAPMGIHKYLVIDGQQRMTTLTILMIALRDYIKDNPSDEVDEDTLTYFLLKNDHQKGDDRYKLMLADSDKDVLIKLIENLPLNSSESSNIYINYCYFKEKIAMEELTPLQIYQSIAKLQIVSITLNNADGDDPQLIFESLNSTGMDLSQSDLIRNFILMGIPSDKQTDIYLNYWKPMEDSFPIQDRAYFIDRFFRDYLTMKLSRIPKIEQIYEEFKNYHTNSEFSSISELASDILLYGKCYTEITLNNCADKELSSLFLDVTQIRMEVAYPFLIKIYGDYKNDIISKDVLIEIVQATIAYVVRRAVCEIPTNSLNKTFATMKNNIVKEDYLNSIKYAFIQLDSYKSFPTDSEFANELEKRDIYKARIINYLLVKLENYNNKEPISFEGFTIEHIMPQNENLRLEWQKALGDNWRDDHAIYLHRLGNLTLTRYNSEMGDKPFQEKLPIFKKSATHNLNSFVIEQTTWNTKLIRERTKSLIEYALNIWPYPKLDDVTLGKFNQPKEVAESKYTFESYDYSNVFVRILFEKLDEAILSINPSIKREYKKLYIAYKYKTNIADIVIQKSRLRVSVNMKFNEVHDPNNICKDITGVGRWGNGDIEISFDSLALLSETIEIIKQSFNKQ